MPPVGAAIAAVGTAIAGTVAAVSAFAASSFIGSFIVNTALSVGLSLLARALAPKPTAQSVKSRGIQTAVTTTGGTEPQAFILGRTATAGHHVCPPMSHDDGGTPNGFLTYVIELSDLPGIGLSRVILNDGYSDLGTTAHPDYGFPLLNQRVGGTDHAWIKFYDGRQTAADPMLVAKYATYPDRPWSSSFVGHGTAYAILTFRYNREVYNNLPKVRVELDGIPLYDPRLDSSVGGTGSQRWSNPATWARSTNPAVMIYNILRGIRLPTGDVWGGDVPAEDLPLDNWFAAMNACDTPIGSRPSFVAGLEVKLEMEPAEVIDELAKTCLGQISEMGGVFRMRVGAPAAPVQFITDEDIVISAPQELEPFPGLAASANAISSEYPEPASLWTSRAAPQITNPQWEAEDAGRRLATSINFPACSHQSQVAHLMTAYIKDARRFRVHRMVLPPKAFMLEPLDTIAWTSQRNGYQAKIFEVVEIIDQPGTINQDLVLRERDPSDYGWEADNDLPAVVPVSGLPYRPPQIIEGWSVSASTLKDALGLDRRPAITLSWVGSAAVDALFVRYEIRLKATAQVVASGLADRAAGSVLVSDGLLPEADYQVRGRYVLDRPTEWSSWLSVTTPGIYLQGDDLRGGIKGLMTDAGLSSVEILDALPSTANFVGRTVYLASDATLYNWSGTEWVSATASLAASDITGQLTSAQIASIEAAKIAGQLTDAQIASINAAKLTGQVVADQIASAAITTAKFASGIRPVEIFSSLPNTGNFAGRTVFLTTDNKLYRHTGSPPGVAGFVASVAAGDVMGQITGTQITDNAITAPKVAANAITAGKIAADAVTAGTIAAGAVSADEIAAGAVTASRLAVFDTSKVFASAFDSAAELADWVNYSGSGELALTSDANATSGGKVLSIGNNSGNDQSWLIHRRNIPVDRSKTYRGKIRVRQPAGAGGLYAGVAGVAADGVTFVNGTGSNGYWFQYYFIAAHETPGTVFVEYEGELADLHPDAKYIRPLILANYDGVAGITHVDSFSIEEKVPGELIVDGAITADKITSNAVTADKIAAGSVVADKIASSAVTAAKISAGAVEAAKIAAGAVVADKIASNAVTAAKISAGAITGDKIAANTITGAKIASNTITSGLISAGAITADKIAATGIVADQIKAGTIDVDRLPGLTEVRYGKFTGNLPPSNVGPYAISIDVPNCRNGEKIIAMAEARIGKVVSEPSRTSSLLVLRFDTNAIESTWNSSGEVADLFTPTGVSESESKKAVFIGGITAGRPEGGIFTVKVQLSIYVSYATAQLFPLKITAFKVQV